MAIQVKICGITTPDAADAALSAGADFAGLVFHRASPRYVAPDLASALAARLRGRAQVVALVADETNETLAGILALANPDFFQLHGNETPERVGEIRARFGKPVIKVISVAGAEDLVRVAIYEQAADMLMFDAKAPANAARPGGHGAAFDWQLLRGRKFAKPWLLAGGLNAENVARAIHSAGAPGVDVSSGVEDAPGKKSPQMIRDFIAAVRTAQFASASP